LRSSKHEHVCSARLERAIERDELDSRGGGKRKQIRIGPDLRRTGGEPRTRTKFPFEAVWLGQERHAFIRPDLIPKRPSAGHGLRIPSHNLLGREEPQNRDLCKAAEEKLLAARRLEPTIGYLGMDVPIPKEGDPDVGIKEIQRVHRFVRW